MELIYQSPIDLRTKDIIFYISQSIRLKGKNKGAKYIEENNIFELEDKIILRIDSKKYQLIEYHFHVEGEHLINGKGFPSEIHFVFYEVDENCECHSSSKFQPKHIDVCGGEVTDEKILVIGRVIKNGHKHLKLDKLQVDVPSKYFEYDGSLTGSGDGSTPVRWIVGDKHICLPLDKIKEVAKGSRPVQNLDNRLILSSC